MRYLIQLLLFFIVLVMVGAGFFAYTAFEKAGPLRDDRLVVIDRGSGVRAIANMLEAAGVIRQPALFPFGTKAIAEGRKLQAGEYLFEQGMSQRAVAEQILNGETHVRRLTIPEGLTSQQIVTLVNAAEGLTGTLETVPPEGNLLPETYHYKWGDSRTALVARMQAKMRKTVDALWPTREKNLPIGSKADAVILASIVEKETGVARERPRVAGVFINRLRKGMRLQSDPTVVYSLTKGSGPLGRTLTRQDWKVDNPYNTYQNAGLPPGPIANPGEASLSAVLKPEKTKYIYFVADGSGGHVFAETLRQHNRNVQKWRAIKRQRGGS